MSKEIDTFTRQIEDSGFPVGKDTPQCFIWRTEHDNCKGCEFALGCRKLAAMMFVYVGTKMYPPKDYQEFLKQQKHLKEISRKIMEAKTIKQLDKLPDY